MQKRKKIFAIFAIRFLFSEFYQRVCLANKGLVTKIRKHKNIKAEASYIEKDLGIQKLLLSLKFNKLK